MAVYSKLEIGFPFSPCFPFLSPTKHALLSPLALVLPTCPPSCFFSGFYLFFWFRLCWCWCCSTLVLLFLPYFSTFILFGIVSYLPPTWKFSQENFNREENRKSFIDSNNLSIIMIINFILWPLFCYTKIQQQPSTLLFRFCCFPLILLSQKRTTNNSNHPPHQHIFPYS